MEQRERLDECESLRGVAITLVFFYHFLNSLRGYDPNPQANFVTGLFYGGSTGVDLFFVLSGFLLSLPFFREDHLRPRQYFANRALRILPMYYFMVLVGVLWHGDWLAGLRAAVFWDVGLGAIPGFSLVWWSLAVEVQFYLALPVCVYLLRRGWGRVLFAAVVLSLCVCYWKIASPSAPEFWASQRNSLLGRWPQFAVGALAAWGHHRYGTTLRGLGGQRRRWIGSLVAFAALAGVDAITLHWVRTFGSLHSASWYANHLSASVFWAIFLVALVDLAPVFRRLIVNPVMHRIGIWSYSIYLVHAVVMVFVMLRLNITPSSARMEQYGPNLLLFLYVAVPTLLISATTYWLIERPFLRLKHGKFLFLARVREDVV